MEQLSLFDLVDEKFTIDREVKLIELFAGIGSQAKAFERLQSKGKLPYGFKHHKISEWAIPSILAYNEIHQDYLEDYGKDFTEGMSKEEMVDYLFNLGISSNYNEPMKKAQISRLQEQKLRQVINAIKSEKNLVDVSKVTADRLELTDYENSLYFASWSFPCQDLSLSGLRKGLTEGSGTRSSLCYECLRIFRECKEAGTPIHVLMMENVPQVIGSNFGKEFSRNILQELENMGYVNSVQILNGKDYGIPQNRERCFCISVYGDYAPVKFGEKQKLKLRLKDMLEDKVDEKYYLSSKRLNEVANWNSINNPLEQVYGKNSIIGTITTRDNYAQTGFTSSCKFIDENQEDTQNRRKQYVNLKRGYSVKGKEENNSSINDVDYLGSYSKSGFNQTSIVGRNGIAPTVTENHGEVTAIVENCRGGTHL